MKMPRYKVLRHALKTVRCSEATRNGRKSVGVSEMAKSVVSAGHAPDSRTASRILATLAVEGYLFSGGGASPQGRYFAIPSVEQGFFPE